MKIVEKNTGKNGVKGIKKSKKSTNEPDTRSQTFDDDDDDLDVDYQEVDKAEKQYMTLKSSWKQNMARMKFAEKRMRWTAHFLLMNLWIPGFKIYFISQSALK